MKRIVSLLLMLALLTGGWGAAAEEEGQAINVLGMSMEQALQTQPEELLADIPVPELEPFVPETLDRVIIGNDDRKVVKKPSEYPYSAIGYMKCRATCGCSWVGTCFMVSKKGLMTAAHCLVCTDHGGTVNNLTIYFGYQSDKNYLYCYSSPCRYWYGTDFSNGDGTYSYQGHKQWDYGYILLEREIGSHTGWFGVKSLSEEDCNYTKMELAGYRDATLFTDSDYVRDVYDQYVKIGHDGLPGQSGSPLFDADNYARGIFVCENPTENFAYRIRPWLINEMWDNGIFD